MRKRRAAALIGAAATALTATSVFVLTESASAHGAMMVPGSRTYLCWKDGLTPQGNIQPTNPACAAALAQGGTNAFYNWFAVLRSDGAGRMEGFIPDGKLCSADARVYDFSGFDLPRNDWPVTHLTAGATIQMRYNKWAAHPGTFRSYITKDSWSPTRPLTWADLEPVPFDQVTDPPSVGGPGSEGSYYYWNARLPAGKTGRHIIYSVWQRSDSNETFYNCSDVVFDGGNGEVTGIRNGGTPPPGPTPTDPPPTQQPGTVCTATFRPTSTWSGGFQGEVTVKNSGTNSTSGWTVHMSLPGGTTVNSLWSGAHTQTGTDLTVKNAAWNGSLAPGASTTFGFVANGTPPTTEPHCMSP
ncbi:lytic polysaccharide monooxygenase auxiliary activity family 9 protein [Thermomonospora cellulosilytica]|uniref:Chitin-binding protein n=1 Tax=Thermomonospora cellulosilytica TaxID=1411118 RepID=A0A7W3R5Z0_9ACTN|nr:lytic polysaccharide monooxygenase [Thermomonospora cellulosilytica]MBA9001603.1 chitin-binding protein [Thermomonospora cellulosilytica]